MREIDLEGELWGPVFEPLRRDRELFRQVRVDEELGTIVWPNGVDMDPDVLSTATPSRLTPKATRHALTRLDDAPVPPDGS